jgi:hypothetical protein
MSRSKQQPQTDEQSSEPTSEPTVTTPPARESGDEPARKFAADPFTIAGDYAAGVKLREHRRFRRAEIEFADGKPSQAVIDKLKDDHFRWNPQDQLWIRPVKGEDAMATRIEAERTYQAVAAMIREEKGLAGPEKPAF